MSGRSSYGGAGEGAHGPQCMALRRFPALLYILGVGLSWSVCGISTGRPVVTLFPLAIVDPRHTSERPQVLGQGFSYTLWDPRSLKVKRRRRRRSTMRRTKGGRGASYVLGSSEPPSSARLILGSSYFRSARSRHTITTSVPIVTYSGQRAWDLDLSWTLITGRRSAVVSAYGIRTLGEFLAQPSGQNRMSETPRQHREERWVRVNASFTHYGLRCPTQYPECERRGSFNWTVEPGPVLASSQKRRRGANR